MRRELEKEGGDNKRWKKMKLIWKANGDGITQWVVKDKR